MSQQPTDPNRETYGASCHPDRYQPSAKRGWVVHKIARHTRARFRVEGFNLWTGERFFWYVDRVDRDGYDLSQVTEGLDLVPVADRGPTAA